MVLAAGLGTRMKPLTDDRPNALVTVAGTALIDHMLDRLAQAGVTRAVVNVHAHADRLIAHLQARTGLPTITISDERSAPLPLETGGGVKHARTLLGEGPIWIANIDSVWIERAPALEALASAWNPARMDTLLLLTHTERALGFDGPGDFFMDGDGRLTPRRTLPDAPTAPFAYMGVGVADPSAAYANSAIEFSLFPIWVEQAKAGRLFGVVLDGDWMHVGDPQAREDAEALLASASDG
ncbi:nucleotidyltransferase family protein [soil metagenome]